MVVSAAALSEAGIALWYTKAVTPTASRAFATPLAAATVSENTSTRSAYPCGGCLLVTASCSSGQDCQHTPWQRRAGAGGKGGGGRVVSMFLEGCLPFLLLGGEGVGIPLGGGAGRLHTPLLPTASCSCEQGCVSSRYLKHK